MMAKHSVADFTSSLSTRLFPFVIMLEPVAYLNCAEKKMSGVRLMEPPQQ